MSLPKFSSREAKATIQKAIQDFSVFYQSSGSPTKINASQRVQPAMDLIPQSQSLQKGRLSLAVAAIQREQIQHVFSAAKLYNTPLSTLQDRLAGALPQAAANAKKRKLLSTEEQSLVQWILDPN